MNGTAVRRPVVAVLGQFKGHVKQTWCTSLELNWPFLRRVEADNVKCPEIYFGTLTMYFGTLACTSRDTPVLLARL